jgi:hypothetical protein
VSYEPSAYVRAALSSLGIQCASLTIEGYSPRVFGNFGATAETDVGVLRILYDREFYVEADRKLPPDLSIQHIVDTLDRFKRSSSNDS